MEIKGDNYNSELKPDKKINSESTESKKITVDEWKMGEDDNANDCLIGLIENNYDLKSMGIEYGSDDYYNLEKKVMDANQEIYGSEEGGWRGEQDGVERSNSILYDNETVILPTYTENKAVSNEIKEEENRIKADEETIQREKIASEISKDIEQTEQEQGIIGKVWDGFKNLTGIGDSSNKAKEAVDDFKNGKISEDEMKQSIENYKEGQKESLEVVSDVVSGITAFGTFAAATGLGIAAAPFTGGASLGLVAAGIGTAGITGAGAKALVKKLDCISGGREYDSLKYDLETGGVNGIFAPITAGLGTAIGKVIAKKAGVEAIKRTGGEIVLKEGLEDTIKGDIAKTLLSTDIKYEGGSLASRSLVLGSDMAVNGSLSGGVYSGTKYLAEDRENKSIEEFIENTATGLKDGLIGAPIIGGGMHLAGKCIGNITGKIEDKILTNLIHAKSAMANTPTVENPDAEVLRNISSIYKELKDGENINPIDFANRTLGIIKSTPDTEAYKFLGDLPERFQNTIETKEDALIFMDAIRNKLDNKQITEEDAINLSDDINNFILRTEQKASSLHSGIENGGILESAEILKERLSKLTSNEDFKNMSREEQIQAIMENSNIFFAKFAQTYSSNESLPKEITDIFKQFTSNCSVSRTTEEAQNLADELYGKGKYNIKKSFGAGTIGETYLATNQDGKDVVIKMLKEGVTPEKFNQDRKMLIKYIEEFTKDEKEKEYKLNLINGMFDAWDKELNFALEAQGAKDMANGAERFNVAQTIEVGNKEGQNISLVMEKAEGIRLDNLLEMINLYRENPEEYLKKYEKEISEHPELKTPEKWMDELCDAYKKAQNEQVMFIGKSGIRTIHADPHPGNIFINFNKESGKPNITYIDTGNVIRRTNSETLQDIALSMNMMIGNSKGVADSLLESAILPTGCTKEETSEKLTKLLDERLFKANVNLTNTNYSQNVINGIMKELNIVQNTEKSNLIKATIQRIETSKAINSSCGNNTTKTVSIEDFKDLARGFLRSFKSNPKETYQTIKPIIKWAYENNNQAMANFFQMIIEKSGTEVSKFD